jgi:hypothetical protein
MPAEEGASVFEIRQELLHRIIHTRGVQLSKCPDFFFTFNGQITQHLKVAICIVEINRTKHTRRAYALDTVHFL